MLDKPLTIVILLSLALGLALPASAANSSGRTSVLDRQENQYSATVILETSSGSRIRTVKRDSFGGFYWAKDFTSSKYLNVGQVRVDASGNVYVGASTIGSVPTFILLKYTSTGALSWSRTYSEAGFTLGGGVGGIVLDSTGNIYMIAWGDGGFNGTGSRLLKFNPSGTRLYVKSIQTQYTTRLANIEIDAANGIYVSGTSDPGNPSSGNLFLAKYDTAGNQLWQRMDAVGLRVGIGDLALDASGQPVAATASVGATSSSLFVEKVTTSGTLLWSNSVTTNGFVPVGVIVDSSGQVALTGHGQGNSTGPDRTGYRVAKLDGLTGALLWNVKWSANSSYVAAIAEEATGSYLTVGEDFNSSTSSTWIRVPRFDTLDGANTAWHYYNVTSENHGYNVLPSSLAGDFYVTGEAFWSNNLYPLNWKVSGNSTLFSWITTTTN